MFETAVEPKQSHAWALISGAIAFTTLVSSWFWIVS